jgi:hypothetical protein
MTYHVLILSTGELNTSACFHPAVRVWRVDLFSFLEKFYNYVQSLESETHEGYYDSRLESGACLLATQSW